MSRGLSPAAMKGTDHARAPPGLALVSTSLRTSSLADWERSLHHARGSVGGTQVAM